MTIRTAIRPDRRQAASKPRLQQQIEKVVDSDNCTGCGLCATLSGHVELQLNADGYLRPVWDGDVTDQDLDDGAAVRRFRSACPGIGLRSPAAMRGTRQHLTMGPYVSAWTAHALDPVARHAGSSAGVLSSLSGWLIESGRAPSVLGAGTSGDRPTRTVPVRLMSREEALGVAGSRYAPVGVASLYDDRAVGDGAAFVGKPCEAYAVRRAAEYAGADPLVLSFFCAGVPSQDSTESLARNLVGDRKISGLRYRGNGWPGNFAVRTVDGETAEVDYEESWGRSLGPTVQNRCKICPDGVGEHADIAVGDFWQADDRGYPTFAESDGNSVAIARTRRGHETLLAAAREGIIELSEVDLDRVSSIQPLQVQRRRTIAPRLLGRLLAGRRVPRYRGYRMLRTQLVTAGSAIAFAREFVSVLRGSRIRALATARPAAGKKRGDA